MTRLAALSALFLALAWVSAAAEPEPRAQPGEAAAPPISADPAKPGKPAQSPYLAEARAPDTVAILPPPPAGHSAAEAADRAAFIATRAYEGGPRWLLATADVAEGTAELLDDFACVLGQRLETARMPALMTLLDRARLDVARATRAPKRHYRRLRPFIGNDASICVARDRELADSFSYPSGHSALGWTYAMIMASLLPEKATPLLVRGRLYGESRVVCGVHWLSDVEAARMTAAAVYAALQGDAGFRADAERARSELTKALGARGTPPDAAICAREAAASREPLF